MARQARLFIPDCPTLILLQGVAGQVVFPNKSAFSSFRDRLPLSAQEEGVDVHAYCLTAGQALLLINCREAAQVGRFVQNLNRHYSPVIKLIKSTDMVSLWTPRFKSTEIQPGQHSLKACLFTEQLALRIGQSQDLTTYPWSSFAAHTGAVNEPWLTDLPVYWQLGNTPFERQARYRQFSEQGLSSKDVQGIEFCLQKGWLWSDPGFADAVQALANRSVGPKPRGRPRLQRD
ncbi:hypothetical protein [Limnobacter litoralis]|uniref:Uncharacterized protein n=1 Tax=Limnobacter litoralis TaxID=481366 RepID=A0ABQ5YT40_9BURK|nr:hypothetical protein [Limnobacter litoralis]GLR25607.1 hypothetical protein GCM10007875_06950 [Limnobacter litoralis]